LVRKRGTIIAFGVPDQPVYAIEFETFFRKNAHLIAVVTPEWREYLSKARDLFGEYRAELEMLVTHRFCGSRCRAGLHVVRTSRARHRQGGARSVVAASRS